jgi:hypothetical protein
MAPKKAPKKHPAKAAKHAAKKGAKHKDEKHSGANDMRKAYEHLGRLAALRPMLAATVVPQLGVLTDLAQQALASGDAKQAKDLLRAGEHLAFGSLAANTKEPRVSEELLEAIHADYEDLTDRAEEHWERHEADRPSTVIPLYDAMREAADRAFDKGAYRRALEFARGAEALAHARGLDRALDAGKPQKKLKA